MSRKFAFHNPEGLFFVSFATIHWIDIFIREAYCQILIDSLDFCRKQKGMQIYAWCIMTNHLHLVFRAADANPGDLMRSFKTFTSKRIRDAIEKNKRESRKSWMLYLMKQAALYNSNSRNFQLWQQDNHPIELWSQKFVDQKVGYTHNNPVVAGFVNRAEDWRYSSAIDYAGGKGLLEIDFL